MGAPVEAPCIPPHSPESLRPAVAVGRVDADPQLVRHADVSASIDWSGSRGAGLASRPVSTDSHATGTLSHPVAPGTAGAWDDEVRAMAALLKPYADDVQQIWAGLPATIRPELKVLLTIPEAAEELRIHRDTVYAFVASGDLKAVDIAASGKRPRTRIRRDDFMAFIDSRTRDASRRGRR